MENPPKKDNSREGEKSLIFLLVCYRTVTLYICSYRATIFRWVPFFQTLRLAILLLFMAQRRVK